MTFRKFPSIEQFRNNIRAVRNRVSYAGKDADGNPIYNHCIFPTLHLVGTVKVHGTNASIAQMKSGAEIEYGSRNGPITPESDNAGFATYHECTLKDSGFDIKSHFEDIRTVLKHDGPIYIYGEWAGGNIQSGVAINGLPKMFIPFAIALYSDDTEEATRTWVLPHHTELLNSTYAPTANWFPIHLFGLHEIDIDYNTPEMVQNKLVEIMQAIEQECPVGKHFLMEHINEFLKKIEENAENIFLEDKNDIKHVKDIRSALKSAICELGTTYDIAELGITISLV